MILAMDTSTEQASISLFSETDGKVISEISWISHRRHTVELMPKVNSLVREAGIDASDLSAIAVALGPGSYTGLRISLSAAKGIVAVTKKPLIGIPTLAVTAYPHITKGLPVLAVLQAGRGRVCWATYEPEEIDIGQSQREYRLGAIEEMVESLQGRDSEILVAGELSEAIISAIEERHQAYRVALPGTNIRRAGHLAAMAWERLKRGEQDDPVTLSPIYLPRTI